MKLFLRIIVFVSGLCSMAIEMTASRMLQNFFSATNIIWACIIGSILIYLSVGNWIGGKIVEKAPDRKSLSVLIILSGISTCVIPLLSRPLLLKSAIALNEQRFIYLFFLFFLLLCILSIPMLILGMINPISIYFYNQAGNPFGNSIGSILSSSTLGSFAGTFIPVFFLIPQFGTSRALIIIGFLLAAVGIGGWIYTESEYKRFLILIVLIFPASEFFLISPKVKNSSNQIFEKESMYNYIEIVEDHGFSLLKINEGQAIQSIYHPKQVNYYGPWEQILTAPFLVNYPVEFASMQNAAILGLAGGTAAMQLKQIFPNVFIDGYEIDPDIIDAARKHMGLKENVAAIHLADGRIGISQSKKRYDVIMVDAYRPPYIAPSMCTYEFFQVISKKLSDSGVLVINIGRSGTSRYLLESLATTAGSVFPSLCVVDIPNTMNSILFASNKQLSYDNLLKNYSDLSSVDDVPELLIETLSVALGNFQEKPENKGLFLSDDSVPVDRITNQIIFNSVFR